MPASGHDNPVDPDRTDGPDGPVPGWRPTAPSYPPILVWPPRPLAALRWLPHYLLPLNASVALAAVVVWWLATPSLESMTSLRPGWVATIVGRNLVITVVVYGLAHRWLYGRRGQGDRTKFNPRWPAASVPSRTLGSQLRENVLWTLASGVPIWSAWEVLTLWLLASGRTPRLDWSDSPVWFIAVFLVLPLVREVHFYATHRLLHWPPLYRSVHRLHHRNVNPSPWSGLSMHPVEHVLYVSVLAVHWVVPTHPVHVLFTALHLALAPIPGHAGFERIGGARFGVPTGGYAHYLHHKLFEVNYADGVIPLDRWFGSFHDGSPAADRRLAERRRLARSGGSAGGGSTGGRSS